MDTRGLIFFTLRFWPGFPKLWLKGDFHSLLLSLLFGWVFAIAWTSAFVWPELFSNWFYLPWIAKLANYGVWLALAGSSLFAALHSGVTMSRSMGLGPAERQKNLEIAQEYYLQANYFDAELILKKNLAKGVEDVESALLWISILRRTRRIPQALELIASTVRLDAATPWVNELNSEKELCLRLKIQTPPAHE